MLRRLSTLAMMVAGCGRVGFDSRSDAISSDSDDECAQIHPADGCTTNACGSACFVSCPTQLSEAAAKLFCVTSGWCLANVETADEATCLAMTASQAAFDPWVGLEQSSAASGVSDLWSWSCPVSPSDVIWKTGQPDDGDGVENGEENCAAYSANGLEDAPCTDLHPFVCVAR